MSTAANATSKRKTSERWAVVGSGFIVDHKTKYCLWKMKNELNWGIWSRVAWIRLVWLTILPKLIISLKIKTRIQKARWNRIVPKVRSERLGNVLESSKRSVIRIQTRSVTLWRQWYLWNRFHNPAFRKAIYRYEKRSQLKCAGSRRH